VLVFVGLGLTTAGAARAGVGGCAELGVRIDGEPSAQWRALVERACLDIDKRFTDPGARTRIVPIDRDLTIEVTLADGRSTTRRVRNPDTLRATLEALVQLPPERRPPEPTEPPANSPASPSELPPPTLTPVPAAPPGSNVGIELGAGLGGRLAAHAYLSLAADAFAQIRVGSWLLGAVFRWDFVGQKQAPLVSTFETETVGAGLLVARRIAVGFGAADVGVTPRLASETQTYEAGAAENSLSATDVRLGVFGRLGFGKGALRGILALDAELSPTRLRRTLRLDALLPPLPAWSLGMSAGILWAAP